MLPLAILNNRTAVIGFVATLLMGIVQFSLLYFLPLYYEVCPAPIERSIQQTLIRISTGLERILAADLWGRYSECAKVCSWTTS